MDVKELLIIIGMGALAGWIASLLLKGGSSGLIKNIILGVIGAFVGKFAFQTLNIQIDMPNVFAENLLVATVGAAILIVISRFLGK
ncbi:MAG: GlsB/YeaQ/YmgE family stress response membrane protein [Aureispira sp.]|nr:GlsB/YeaQ/YmgE family stress response membrane protein [Aureispira sp.]